MTATDFQPENEEERGWFNDTELSWLQRQCVRVLRAGATPVHMAFIMDGNRRFARKQGYASVLQGHVDGFTQLSRALKWCRDFGVKYVTVYAFSIENFKRSQEEVDGLMDLARQKMQHLLTEKERIAEHGVRFRFFGNLARLPADLQRLIAQVQSLTQKYDTHHINVCLSYTSQDEIVRAMQTAVQGIRDGRLQPGDMNASVLSACLDTYDCPPPDLLVRTSGEQRMSDFMLWQSQWTCLYFDKVLWPEFNFWHLAYAVYHYQWYHDSIQHTKQRVQDRSPTVSEEQQQRIDRFVDYVHKQKLNSLGDHLTETTCNS